MRIFILAMLVTATTLSAQSPRIVLAEVFTNSHCTACPTAYKAVADVITNTSRASRVVTVFNHVPVYQDDLIYQANKTEPIQRGQFLGGVSGTPTVYINGARKPANGSGWDTYLDGLLSQPSEYSISMQVLVSLDSVTLEYSIAKPMGNASVTIYGLLVEDITYAGRNGISEHKGALRKLFTPPSGVALDFNMAGVATGRISVRREEFWNIAKMHGVVSVQDPNTKASLQAQMVPIATTSVEDQVIEDDGSEAEVAVFSVSGGLVATATGDVPSGSVINRFIPSHVPSGMYYVRVKKGNNISVYPVSLSR